MATLEEIDESCSAFLVPDEANHQAPNSSQEIYSFQGLYETACDRIRVTNTLDDVMKDFEALINDYRRAKYILSLPEIRQLSIKQTYMNKNMDEASQLEEDYNWNIIQESTSQKALSLISRSLKLTPEGDATTFARRYRKRGWASLMLEDFEAAKIDAERSLQIETDPQYAWNSYEILGHCRAKDSEFKAAEGYFKQALGGLRISQATREEKAMAAGRISLVFKNIKGRKDLKPKKTKLIPETLPKVMFAPHPVLKSATEAVNVIVSDQKGRCLLATKDLKPGDVIIVEKPFAASLNYDCFESHCSTCFKRLNAAAVPCQKCTSVWFCDEKCHGDEFGHHKVECPILLLLNNEAMSKMAILVFRILLKQGWKKLKENKETYMKILDDQHTSMPKTSKKWEWKQHYSSLDFETIFHLVTNDDKRTFGDLFKRALTGVFLAFCLKEVNFLGEDSSEEEHVLYLASLSLRLLQVVSCNAYGITEYLAGSQGPAQAELIEVGGAVYPTISLTNHSCWPNASRYSVGTTCILRATRGIPKGHEVLDNYGQHYISTCLCERQELLLSQYKFHCECEACLNSWPIYPHSGFEQFTFKCPGEGCRALIPFLSGEKKPSCSECGETKKVLSTIEQIKNKLYNFNKALKLIREGSAEKALKVLIDHQKFLDQNAVPPGKMFSDSQEAIRQCFTVLGNSHFVKEETKCEDTSLSDILEQLKQK